MRRETALLGCSFNPVHIGHLYLIHDAYTLASVERVVIIPALISNFKRGSSPLDFETRTHLLHLAKEDYRDMFPVDDIEIEISRVEKERGGVSYTSDTIRHFLPLYGNDGKVSFIIGDDLLSGLERWHEYDYLKDHVRFLCFTRDGNHDGPEDADIVFFRNEKVISSSTDVSDGNLDMLSERVRRYVEDNELYRG